MKHRITQLVFLFLFSALIANNSQAEDWAKWRGPRANGTWNGPELKSNFTAADMPIQWKHECGGGYAGISAANNRVYLYDRLAADSTKEENSPATVQESERLQCFDLTSGDVVWTHQYDVSYNKLDYGNGPRAAPTVTEKHVYICGALGHLKCLNISDGTEVWSRHFQKDFSGRQPFWGYSASPVVHGDLLIVQPGADQSTIKETQIPSGSILALNRFTGELVWNSLSDRAGYCTPIIARRHDMNLLIFWTPSHIRGLDADEGTPLWSFPYEVQEKVSIATPIVHQDTVLVCGYWDGSRAIKLGKTPTEAELLWEDRRNMRGLMSQPIYRGDFCYLLDKTYGLTCFNLQTAKKEWDDKNQMTPRGRNPQASLVWHNNSNKALILNAEGEFICAKLSPEKYDEKSRVKLLGKTWAHPAYAGNFIIARSDTQIACFRLPLK